MINKKVDYNSDGCKLFQPNRLKYGVAVQLFGISWLLLKYGHLFQNKKLHIILVQIKMQFISTVEIHCSEKPIWTDRDWRSLSWRHEEDPLPLPNWANSLLRCPGCRAEEESCGEGTETRYCTMASAWRPLGHCSALIRRHILSCICSLSHLLLFLRKWSFWSPPHSAAGEWSEEDSWYKSSSHLPKSEYNTVCSVIKIGISIIHVGTQNTDQIRKDASFTIFRMFSIDLCMCFLQISAFFVCVLYLQWEPLSIFVIIWYHTGNLGNQYQAYCFSFLLNETAMQNCVCVQKQQKWVLSRVLISCEFKLNMLLAVISRLDAVVVSFPLRQYHLYRTFDKAVTSSRCLGDVYTDTSTHAITRTWKSKKCCKFWEKRNVRGKTDRTWIFTWLCSAWLLCQHYWKLKDRKCSWYWKSRAMWINANI